MYISLNTIEHLMPSNLTPTPEIIESESPFQIPSIQILLSYRPYFVFKITQHQCMIKLKDYVIILTSHKSCTKIIIYILFILYLLPVASVLYIPSKGLYLRMLKEFAPKSIKVAKKKRKINTETITQLLIDTGVLVYPIGV